MKKKIALFLRRTKMNTKNYEQYCLDIIPEGTVLLENDGTLPLAKTDKVALFGRAQHEYVKSGSGSGGRVNCPHVWQFAEELKARVQTDIEVEEFYRKWIEENPWDENDGWNYFASQKQPFLSEEFVAKIAARNDKAIFVTSRSAGESCDCKIEKGNWYLSEEEEQTIAVLRKYFKRFAVVLNAGNIIDMSWVKTYSVGSVVYAWQGGQEGARGTVNALMGDVSPSGKLPDTIAKIEDYPAFDCFGDEVKNVHKEDIFVGYRYFETFAKDKVIYPFGYGLSYTEFQTETLSVKEKNGIISVCVRVTNIGKAKGKEVVQVYYSAPQGTLGRAAKELAAYKKTKELLMGESEELQLSFPIEQMAAYDESGKSGFSSAWVLEKGEYGVFVGVDVRSARKEFSFHLDETRIVRQCVQALAPVEKFQKMATKDGKTLIWEDVVLQGVPAEKRMKDNMPKAIGYKGDRGYTLYDVAENKVGMDEFIAQFDDTALCEIVRGEGMSSMKAPIVGTASCFAGVTSVWRKAGVPVVTTCDGPGGLRMEVPVPCTAIPVGTLLAATWAEELTEKLFYEFAEEMKYYKIDVILGPGINIHRHPLCGRNFEYYSEDPYLAGRFAATISGYFEKNGVHATLKHFACNSQEFKRGVENEVLSERALREIYLKPFEMAVRSGNVQSIMTSYNRVNGVSACANYDLTTEILRDDWGYTGFVMTDWWSKADEPRTGTHEKTNLTAMIKAQNDSFMVCPDATKNDDDLESSLKENYLTRGELERSAKNILDFSMKTLAFERREPYRADFNGKKGKLIHDATITGEWLTLYFEKEGTYYAEIEYSSETDELVQFPITIRMNWLVSSIPVVSGTNGKKKWAPFKIYCTKKSDFLFETKEPVYALRIYELLN